MRNNGHRHKNYKDDPGLVTIAIDKDKSSQSALKWAVDHLIPKDHIFILLHVRRKATTIQTPSGQQISLSEVSEDVASAYRVQIDLQTKELLLPFQCFCNRRGLHCKEVILDDTDIPKAIINFVTHEVVDKLVFGSSSRNALIRTFKGPDVPTCVSRAAPDFCSVYVISKGRISSVRPAPHPNKSSIKREPSGKLETSIAFQSVKSDPSATHLHVEEHLESLIARKARTSQGSEYGFPNRVHDSKIGEKTNKFSQVGGQPDSLYQSIASCPSPSRTSTDQHISYAQRDYTGGRADVGAQHSHISNLHGDYYDDQMGIAQSNRMNFESVKSAGKVRSIESNRSGILNVSGGSNAYEHEPPLWQQRTGTSCSSSSQENSEAEVRRLKLELQQTMNMYSNACKDALSAKHKTRDLHSWKLEEEKRMEDAKFSREVAIQFAEKEKERYEAALEAAEVAQKLAGIGTRKRAGAEKILLHGVEGKQKVLDALASDVRYRKYTIEVIRKATNNFSEDLKIGEGGYGPVYKSTLDHTLVAIKILRPDTAQGMKQFQQEVEVLNSIRHPNMVLLMGACPEYGCLIYEYMANGSLEDRLFCCNSTPPLSLQQRFKIAAEIATGLLFLHQTKPEPLVHRDLKPGNILLDQNFVSKIADVGLARLVPPSVADAVTQYHMTAAAGTFCYIDPEYQKTGMLGIKSDIYALGVILLQLVTGKPPMGLTHKMEEALERGEMEEMLDHTVPDWPMEETYEFVKLALKCAELRKKDRPDLGNVVLPILNRLRDLAYESQPIPMAFHSRANDYQVDFKNSEFLDESRRERSESKFGGFRMIKDYV